MCLTQGVCLTRGNTPQIREILPDVGERDASTVALAHKFCTSPAMSVVTPIGCANLGSEDQPHYHGGGHLPGSIDRKTYVLTPGVYAPKKSWALRPLTIEEVLLAKDNGRVLAKLLVSEGLDDRFLRSLVPGKSLLVLARRWGCYGGGFFPEFTGSDPERRLFPEFTGSDSERQKVPLIYPSLGESFHNPPNGPGYSSSRFGGSLDVEPVPKQVKTCVSVATSRRKSSTTTSKAEILDGEVNTCFSDPTSRRKSSTTTSKSSKLETVETVDAKINTCFSDPTSRRKSSTTTSKFGTGHAEYLKLEGCKTETERSKCDATTETERSKRDDATGEPTKRDSEEILDEIDRGNRERKAVKADDAKVPEYLWEEHLLEGLTHRAWYDDDAIKNSEW
jgi:hypothetical protein